MLFGVAFWMVGRSLKDKSISDYMKFSAFGIILLSMSNQDSGLYLLSYPPFGIPTSTFVGISSYMLFVGIYYSSISVYLNTEVRKSIDKSVEQEFEFVSKIGISQMEHEIESRVKELTKRSARTLEEKSGIEVSLDTLPRPYDRNLISNTFTIDQGILEKTLEFAPGEGRLLPTTFSQTLTEIHGAQAKIRLQAG
jgi:hypothetical protein